MMRRALLAPLLVALLFCLANTTTLAKEAVPLAEDPVLEQRLLAISEELRCLVCQNETIAASRSDLANDLRREIRTLIRAGRSDAQIMEFMVGRYGDFVRYRPPLKASTVLLWIGPFALLLGGVLALLKFLRGRTAGGQRTLSAEQQRRAAALIDNPDS